MSRAIKQRKAQDSAVIKQWKEEFKRQSEGKVEVYEWTKGWEVEKYRKIGRGKKKTCSFKEFEKEGCWTLGQKKMCWGK